MAVLTLIALSCLVCGYACYVAALVIQADFYSRPQKIAQCLIVLLLPLIGALLAHLVYSSHRAPAKKPDRAFTPQREPPPDELRGFHPRHPEES